MEALKRNSWTPFIKKWYTSSHRIRSWTNSDQRTPTKQTRSPLPSLLCHSFSRYVTFFFQSQLAYHILGHSYLSSSPPSLTAVPCIYTGTSSICPTAVLLRLLFLPVPRRPPSSLVSIQGLLRFAPPPSLVFIQGLLPLRDLRVFSLSVYRESFDIHQIVWNYARYVVLPVFIASID